MKTIARSMHFYLMPVLALVLFISGNSVLAQDEHWSNFDDRSLADIAKGTSSIEKKLLNSPQKVEVNATGNFNLSLPLMTVPGRAGLNFDLALTYTPGIKATDEASWVGLGWNLDVGSVVRHVTGIMDETINKKYYGPNNDPDNLTRDIYDISCPGGDARAIQFDDPADPTNKYILQFEEWRPWKITYDYTNHRFIVIAEDGTTYVFGLGAPGATTWNGSVDPTCGDVIQSVNDPYMQWHLTAILGPDYFDGDGDPYDPTDSYTAGNGGKWIRIYWSYDGTSTFKEFLYDTKEKPTMGPRPGCGTAPDISLTSVTYPRYIVTPTHVAEFETELEVSNPISELFSSGKKKRRLKCIKLYRRNAPAGVPSGLTDPIQQLDFAYGWSGTLYVEKRSVLQSVTITAGTITLPPYTFTYYDGSSYAWNDFGRPYYFGPMFEPNYNKIGFLGWYNSAHAGLPKFDRGGSEYFKGGQYDGQIWNLDQVNYPGGGSINFDYESNRYVMDFSYTGLKYGDDTYSPVVWGAGCRLTRQVINHGSSGSTEYTYMYGTKKNDETFVSGVGRMYADPIDYGDAFASTSVNRHTWPPDITASVHTEHWLFFQAPHQVLYQQITETQPDYSLIKSYYAVPALDENIAPGGAVNDQNTFENTIPRRGLLEKREFINATTEAVVKKEEFFREETMLNSTWSNGTRFSYRKEWEKKTTTVYDEQGEDGVVSMAITYYSPNNGLPSIVSETDGESAGRYTHYRYPLDFNTTLGDAAISAFIGRNQINPVLASWVEDVDQNIWAATIWDYSYAKPYPLRVFSFSDGSPVSGISLLSDELYGKLRDANTYDSRFKIQKEFVLYDGMGNLTVSKDANGVTTKHAYGHNKSVRLASFKNTGNGMICADDFNDASFSDNDPFTWTTTGQMEASSGILKMYGASYAGNHTQEYQNFTADVEMQITYDYGNAYNWAAVHFGSTSTDIFNTGYFVFYRRNGQINLYKQGTTLATAETQLPLNINRRLSISVNGNNIQAFVDGQRFINYTDASAVPSGYISLNTYYAATNFDNFRAYPFGALAQSYAYDPKKLLVTQQSDGNLNSGYLSYDDLGRISTTYGPRKIEVSQNSYPDLVTTETNVYLSQTQTGYKKSITDAFGKPVEQQIRYQPDQYIYTYQSYDEAGRLELNTNPNGISTEYLYSPDPLNRILEQGVRNWANNLIWKIGGEHTIRQSYGSNILNEVAEYPVANTLYKITATNENSSVSINFADVFGNVVQTVNNYVPSVTNPDSQNLTTKFSYDVMGNLKKSIPPKGNVSGGSPSGTATTYTYNTLNLLTKKITPDAGTTEYVYDGNGNLRFVKDANHGGATSYWSRSNYLMSDYTDSFSEIMPLPGNAQINMTLYTYPSAATASVTIKSAGGATIFSASCDAYNPNYSAAVYLPKGTYEFSFTLTSDPENPGAEFYYEAYNTTDNRVFIYNKYDKFNRLTEQGEYISTSTTFYFNETNANDRDFPSSNKVVTKQLFYDTPSTNPLAAGQRNLKGKISYTYGYRPGAICDESYFSYNENGRVEWVVKSQLGWYPKKLMYEYDLQGNVTKRGYVDLQTNRNMYTFYEYDQAGRLSKVYTGPNADGTGKVQDANYSYTLSGKVSQLQLGSVQTINYSYNERDWLTAINNPLDFAPTMLFGMKLGYYTPETWTNFGAFKPQYNGNISWATYRMANVTTNFSGTTTDIIGWKYNYNNANQLISADLGHGYYGHWNTTSYYDESFSYDPNGNLKTLNRNLGNGTPANISYSYSATKNRLLSTTNGTYQYDGNGNVVVDTYRGISFIMYDINNLPVTMYKTNGNVIVCSYDASGNRVRKYKIGVASDDMQYVNSPDGKTEVVQKGWYNNNYTYNIWGNDNLGQVTVTSSTANKYYYLKDHLGNIRVTVNSAGTRVGNDDYTPFGMQMDGRSYVSSADARFKFTGKERDVETGYDYFGARYYDSRIGRWLSVDPLAVKRAWLSPYNFVQNSPLCRIDPDGKFDFSSIKDERLKKYLQMAAQNAYDRIYKGNKGERTVDKIYELLGANTEKTQKQVDAELKEIFTNESGPKVELGEVKGGLAETKGDKIIIKESSRFIRDVVPQQGIPWRAQGKAFEGVTRIFEHEPIHVQMNKYHVKETDARVYIGFHQYDSPNMIQAEKYEGREEHMQFLQNELLDAERE